MSHALPYLKSRQKRTTHLTLRYTFDQLVQAPLEQHSREYTWQIGGPPSPTTYYHISLLWDWLRFAPMVPFAWQNQSLQVSVELQVLVRRRAGFPASGLWGWNDFTDCCPSFGICFFVDMILMATCVQYSYREDTSQPGRSPSLSRLPPFQWKRPEVDFPVKRWDQVPPS